MNSPWSIPPPPGVGTPGPYGYQQSESITLKALPIPSKAHSNSRSDAPAYVPVHVRQSFGPPLPYVPMPLVQQQQPLPPPPPRPSPVEAPQPRKKMTFPQAVRDYVQRSFLPHLMRDDVTRPEMEAKLKETIAAATDSNTLETLDWENLPLPQEMIRQERAQAAALAWKQESVHLHMSGNGYVPSNNSASKKRKSQDIGGGNDGDAFTSSSTPPWRTTNNRNALEDRVSLQSSGKDTFDKRQQPFQDDSSHKGTSKFQKNLEKRQRRFDGGYKSSYKPSPSPDPMDGPVVGTSQVLEKQYFRLTAPPIPSQVRPESILRQTLELLKKKWKKEGNYNYICDQFKSMRQDLTVQRIKNEFTVTVYEIHARIALEKGDLGEYNQCQTQLRALYEQNLGGNPVEFKAYRILYYIHTSNRTALNDVLADLTTAEKEENAIKHALNVRSSLALGNYHRFFRLYLDTPNMGAYLMDMFVVRERLAAMSNICKA